MDTVVSLFYSPWQMQGFKVPLCHQKQRDVNLHCSLRNTSFKLTLMPLITLKSIISAAKPQQLRDHLGRSC